MCNTGRYSTQWSFQWRKSPYTAIDERLEGAWSIISDPFKTMSQLGADELNTHTKQRPRTHSVALLSPSKVHVPRFRKKTGAHVTKRGFSGNGFKPTAFDEFCHSGNVPRRVIVPFSSNLQRLAPPQTSGISFWTHGCSSTLMPLTVYMCVCVCVCVVSSVHAPLDRATWRIIGNTFPLPANLCCVSVVKAHECFDVSLVHLSHGKNLDMHPLTLNKARIVLLSHASESSGAGDGTGGNDGDLTPPRTPSRVYDRVCRESNIQDGVERAGEPNVSGSSYSLIACVALLRQSVYYTRKLAVHGTTDSASFIEPLLLTSDIKCKGPFRNVSNPSRCHALDRFRGLTLCLMVFVNYGGAPRLRSCHPSIRLAHSIRAVCDVTGGGFSLFQHSVWDGLTLADLIFPWYVCVGGPRMATYRRRGAHTFLGIGRFAWILGFSIFFTSLSRRPTSSTPLSVSRIGKRTLRLWMLGLFVNNGTNWSAWRLPGVLQALGVAYCLVALADACLPYSKRCHRLLFLFWHGILGILPLVLVNLLLTFQLPVPGCPTGYIGPGGSADDGAYRNCTGGAHFYLDAMVFGLEHLFQTPTCQKRYETGPYDPEGLLNWFMVSATAYFGYLQAFVFTTCAGSSPMTRTDIWKNTQLRHLMVSGSGFILLSIATGGLWIFPHGPWIPLNKNLWSLSYVLLSSGLAAWILALFVWSGDRGDTNADWSGAPCLSMGKNSIVIYVMVRYETGNLETSLISVSDCVANYVMKRDGSTKFASSFLHSLRNPCQRYALICTFLRKNFTVNYVLQRTISLKATRVAGPKVVLTERALRWIAGSVPSFRPSVRLINYRNSLYTFVRNLLIG
ncbi:hypothetical protein PsorP6_001611 [Peronosclerospora sorghi]|uniref:Uncharacterized protein n=1 Tax=Peronosclerospora sorghi TaxID=230839 RepID=A0ACC0WX09_9STRA|nr:hypothetical protein PsorP6_001611 [Peronosclerospora sorghi]